MTKQQLDRLFDIIFTVLLVILVVGIPLVFTSLTRSVFEVNKLLLLRVVTIVTMSVWIIRGLLYKDNGVAEFRWQKIGLEIPLLLWVGVNIVSTLFSQNLRLSIIGAYDRWEGLITIVNYVVLILMFAKLVTKEKMVHWVVGGILVSTGLSGIYGVMQSLGMDFMNWSVDPTQRVFACINNPVHYCAYVGMVVPLGIGWLLYLSATQDRFKFMPKWIVPAKWIIFFLTVIIYYNQFLSYSRATWLGFIAAMTLFYLFVNNNMDRRSERYLLVDFFFTCAAIAAFYLTDIFNLHQKGLVVAVPVSLVLALYVLYSYFGASRSLSKDSGKTEKAPIDLKELAILAGISLLLFLTYVLDLSRFGLLVESILYLILVPLFLFVSFHLKDQLKQVVSRLVIILIFAKLQFIAISWTSMFLYTSLLVAYYFMEFRNAQPQWLEKRVWLMSFLMVFALVIVAPSLPSHIAKLFADKSTSSLTALSNVQDKVSSYEDVAIKGTARTSMWKSSVGWIKDFWLIGSGPDTIKYMYPKYRRADYGILEGGHNFTPDRLHNEYLNTIATRGVVGFVIYYGLVIIGWCVLIVKGEYLLRRNPYRYVLLGVFSGAVVYLGQVLFNFGVVATLFLFYVYLGLGLAIVRHPDFRNWESNDNT